MSEPSADRVGLAPYKGYEYQILTTVWLALELMLARSTECDCIEVEPASEEDVRARLKVAAEEARPTLRLPAPTEIQVQIKYRSRPLSAAGLKDIVSPAASGPPQRGPTPRLRPLEYLRGSEGTTYLLVTSAQVDAALSAHRIQRPGDRCAASRLPFKSELSEEDQARISPRLGILEQQTPEAVQGRIQRLLREKASVPSTFFEECLAELMRCVRDRLLGVVSRDWPREELFRVLRRFDGLPKSPHENFIPPGNLGVLRGRLEQEYALVLHGPPGVGKSATAEVLVHEHRLNAEPFKIVRTGVSATEVRQLMRDPGRHLFYLDDIWGGVTVSPEAQRWRSELAYLLSEAGPDKRFLITSRTSVFQAMGGAAGVPEDIRRRVEPLLPEHYSNEDRLRILQHELQDSPRTQDFVLAHAERILQALEVPFALLHFARRLRKQPCRSERELETLLKQSSMEVIGATLAEELQASRLGGASPAAALAGFLFLLRNPISEEDVRGLSGVLHDAGHRDVELEAMIHRLLREEWVELREDGYRAHPLVIEGLLLFFNDAPLATTNALVAWLVATIDSKSLSATLRLVLELDQRKRSIPSAVELALDTFLVEHAASAPDDGFSEALERLSLFSRGVTSQSLVARRLVGSEGFTLFPGAWIPAEWSSDERERVRSSSEARELVARFVRLGWVTSRRRYSWSRFSKWSRDLGWNFTSELRSAVHAALRDEGEQGIGDSPSQEYLEVFEGNLHDLIEGALEEGDAPVEELLLLALEAASRTRRQVDAALNSMRLAGLSQPTELFREMPLNARRKAYENALATVVDIRRRREGCAWLVSHPRRRELAPAFAESIHAAFWPYTSFLSREAGDIDARPRASLDEIMLLHGLSEPSDKRWIWLIMFKAGASAFVPMLLEDLRCCPLEHLAAGVQALKSLVDGAAQADAFSGFIESADFPRRVVLAEVRRGRNSSLPLEGLSPAELQVVALCQAAIRQEPSAEDVQSLSLKQRAWLYQLAQQHPEVLGLGALLVLVADGRPLDELESSVKVLSHDVLLCVALSLLVRNSAPEVRAWILKRLEHAHARVRASAIQVLAPAAMETERWKFIQMTKDPSGVVQRASAVVIGERRWLEGTDALFELLSAPASPDVWEHPHASMSARAAASALVAFPDLPVSDVQRCIEFVERGVGSTLDLYVRCDLLPVLARASSRKALEVLEACLVSSEAIQGQGDTLAFPLRYAGAWALFAQLRAHPEARAWVRLDAVVWAASHPDPKLAAPALLIMGMLASRFRPRLRELLTAGTMSSRRALLLGAGSLFSGEAWLLDAHERAGFIQPADASGALLLARLGSVVGHGAAPEVALCRKPEVLEWLVGLQAAQDVDTVLHWSLFELFGRHTEAPLGLKGMSPDSVLTAEQSLGWLAKEEWRTPDLF